MDTITELVDRVYQEYPNNDYVSFVLNLIREMKDFTKDSKFDINLYHYLRDYLNIGSTSAKIIENSIPENNLAIIVCNTLDHDLENVMLFMKALNEKIADKNFSLRIYRHLLYDIQLMPNFN